MSDFDAEREQELASVAARQHGVVAVSQLRRLGFDKSAVHRRMRMGRLHPLHHGVYAVGHIPASREAGWMAAVLACGDGAALSHVSAAALWGLLRPVEGPVDVSISTKAGRARRAGIRLHRRASPIAPYVTKRLEIPVTIVVRTIADLEGTVPPRWHRRAIRQAELFGFDLGEIESDGTRSDLESEFLRLCRRHGLPQPETNVRIGRWTVDFLWRERRLVVETDGWRYHRGRIASQDDRARELDLRGLGFELRRFDERQLSEEPERVAADLAEALNGVVELPRWPRRRPAEGRSPSSS